MRTQQPKAWLAIFKLCPPKDEVGHNLDVREVTECATLGLDDDYLMVKAIYDHIEYYFIYCKPEKKFRLMQKVGGKLYGHLEPTPEIIHIWIEDYIFSSEIAEQATEDAWVDNEPII